MTQTSTAGSFSPISGSPFGTGSQPQSLAYSPLVTGGAFLGVANFGHKQVSCYQVNSTSGALTAAPGSPTNLSATISSIAFSPRFIVNNEEFLYAALPKGGTNYVLLFKVNSQTGQFTEITKISPFSLSPLAFPFPNGIAYSPVIESINTCFAAMTTYTPVPAPAPDPFSPMPCEPSAPPPSKGSVSVFQVDPSSGAFVSPGSDFAMPSATPDTGAPIPTQIAYSPIVKTAGKSYLYLAVTSASANTISVYQVNLLDAPGSLTLVSSVAIGGSTSPFGGAYAVAFSPFIEEHISLFLSVTNASSGGIYAYQVNPTTGTLKQISGSPFSTGTASSGNITATGLAYSPLVNGSLFVAATNSPSNQVFVYQADLCTGVLNPVSGSPFVTGNYPSSIAFSSFSNGNLFAAVANYHSIDISVYRVEMGLSQ